MKKCLLFLTLLAAHSLVAQIYTAPDSLLLVKQKVRQMTVYTLGKDSVKKVFQEIQYDKQGRKIYETQEMGRGAYFTYRYDSQSRLIETRFFTKERTLKYISRTQYDQPKYDRYVRHFDIDTVYPRYVYGYNKKNQRIYEAEYVKTALTRLQKNSFDKYGRVMANYDSLVGKYIRVTENYRLVREVEFVNTGRKAIEELYAYPNDTTMLCTDIRPGQAPKVYTVYLTPDLYVKKIVLAEKELDQEATTEWSRRHLDMVNVDGAPAHYPFWREPVVTVDADAAETKPQRTFQKGANGLLASERFIDSSGHVTEYVFGYAYFK